VDNLPLVDRAEEAKNMAEFDLDEIKDMLMRLNVRELLLLNRLLISVSLKTR